ncbi:DHHA2 domain-containing protein [Pseudoscourfieldia marina]
MADPPDNNAYASASLADASLADASLAAAAAAASSATGGAGIEGWPLSSTRPLSAKSWGSFTNLLETATAISQTMPSDAMKAMDDYRIAVERIAQKIVERTADPTEGAFIEETFAYKRLKGVCFVGHVKTDLDSVAGAIGAANLFDGLACRSEDNLNGEITYVLNEVANVEVPPLFDETAGAGLPDENGEKRNVCLVDHNEPKQMVPSLASDMGRIIGCIDHHALSEGFASSKPLLIDIRPWGSMSTIITHLYIRLSSPISKSIARLLMCAILSDTLALRSVTTTDADRFAVAMLAKLGEIESPDTVAKQMFKNKTRWICNLGPYAMVRGDQKDFTVEGWKMGIAVLEVTDTAPVLAIADKLLLELRILKKEKGDRRGKENDVTAQLDFAFLFVVDVVKQCSVLLVCGGREYALASKAFPGCEFRVAKEGMGKAPGTTIALNQTLCDAGSLVSRKAQFVPALSQALASNFTCHRARVTDPSYKQGTSGALLDRVLSNRQAEVRVSLDGQQLERDVRVAESALYDQKW